MTPHLTLMNITKIDNHLKSYFMTTKEAIENTKAEIESAIPGNLKQVVRCIDAYLALETGYRLSVHETSNPDNLYVMIHVSNEKHLISCVIPAQKMTTLLKLQTQVIILAKMKTLQFYLQRNRI